MCTCVCVCMCTCVRVCVLYAGTEKARSITQTLLDVPYGDGDGEKLDVYAPSISSSPGAHEN